MKYYQLLSVLMEQPLLITPAAHASLVRLFQEHRQLNAMEFRAAREGVDICGRAVELEQMEIIDGIAHIPIGGPIGRGLGKFEKGAGAVDVDDVMEELSQALADPECYAALLDIDSPGGMINGTPELADAVSAFDKPIYAFSGGQICSAAYWVACASDGVFASKSADIGAVGVYAAFTDQSKMAEMAGLKVDVITSGKYKGMMTPGTALSQEQRDFLQSRINGLAQDFYEQVLSNRPDVVPADMQGQVFGAKEAMAKGFIDDIVQNKDDVVALLQEG